MCKRFYKHIEPLKNQWKIYIFRWVDEKKGFLAKGNLQRVDFNVYNVMLRVWWANNERNVNREIVVCVRNDLKSIMERFYEKVGIVVVYFYRYGFTHHVLGTEMDVIKKKPCSFIK